MNAYFVSQAGCQPKNKEGLIPADFSLTSSFPKAAFGEEVRETSLLVYGVFSEGT